MLVRQVFKVSLLQPTTTDFAGFSSGQIIDRKEEDEEEINIADIRDILAKVCSCPQPWKMDGRMDAGTIWLRDSQHRALQTILRVVKCN